MQGSQHKAERTGKSDVDVVHVTMEAVKGDR